MARKRRPVGIVLDVMMPGMDGWTLLTHLKADPQLRGIPVIMLTMMDDRKTGFALGADNYLTKPVDRKLLGELLKKYRCDDEKCTVLVVEDDLETRQMMQAMLERSGWVVTMAENGRVAIEMIALHRPTVVLLDLMMPEMDGFEFASEMHKTTEWQDIPIIVLTAKDLSDHDLLRLNGNVQTILDKRGFSREELMIQVKNSLTARREVSEPIVTVKANV